MKPDKHKQKRTQQYKKKHGVKDDKSSSQPTNGNASTASASGTVIVRGRGGDHPSATSAAETSTPTSIVTGTDGTLPGSDNKQEVASTVQHRPSFKRREVVSNWERYAGIHNEPEEIHSESRGADFKTLLGSTSSAAAQFRLADEQKLDEEVSSGGTPELHGLLTVDAHALAAALDCVPLHTKLNIEHAVFRKEDIDLFEQVAMDNRKLYLEARKNSKFTEHIPNNMESVHKIWSDEQDILDIVVADYKPAETSEVGNAVDARKANIRISEENGCKFDVQIEDDLNELLGSQVHTYQNNSGSDTKDKIVKCSDPVERQTSQDVHSTCCTEEDVNNGEETQIYLPKLSNADDTPSNCVSGSESTREHKQTQIAAPTVKSLEDDLDTLLSLDTDDEPASNVTKSRSLNNTSADKDNDLEDWLDTILDD